VTSELGHADGADKVNANANADPNANVDQSAVPASAAPDAPVVRSGSPPNEGSASSGVLMALCAHAVWGLSPIFYKALATVSPLEVIAFRGLSSLAVAGGYLSWQGRLSEVRAAIADRSSLLLLTLSSLVVMSNWGAFVWGVGVGRTLEISFGYFICPIVSVALGVFLLGEQLTRTQGVAVALAAIAIAVQWAGLGAVPWLALFLAVSFAVYGYLRKQMVVKATPGLFIETLVGLVPAIALFGWLMRGNGLAFADGDAWIMALLLLTGPMTAIPLILFAASSRRLRLVTVGLLQFCTPTLHFVCGTLIFGEPLDALKLTSFLILWTALALVVRESWRQHRAAAAG